MTMTEQLTPRGDELQRSRDPIDSVGDSLDVGNGKPRNFRRKRFKTQRMAKPLPSSSAAGKLLAWGPKAVLSEMTTSSLSSSFSSPDSSFSPESSPEIEENEEEEEAGGDEGRVEEKESRTLEVTCLSHGMASVIGRRKEMEDTARAELGFFATQPAEGSGRKRKLDFFGVFDGHGGGSVAEACRDRMHRILETEIGMEIREGREILENIDWENVMVRGFEKMDMEVGRGSAGGGGGRNDVNGEEMTVGSTAVVAVVGTEKVVVANCGDSRAVICRNEVALPLSVDHKPERPDELARIEAAGGKVISWNGHRVLGVLATSRSIGDNYLKPYVIPRPEVTVSRRTEEDEFLILASDGLWDLISNEMACQVVRRCLDGSIAWRREGRSAESAEARSGAGRNEDDGDDNRASDAAALLVELAMARGSGDNISVVVAELNPPRKHMRST